MDGGGMNWTDERTETLKRLWAAEFSASHIAAELGGITRNSVIGKVHRLKLPRRMKPQDKTAKTRARKPRTARTAPAHVWAVPLAKLTSGHGPQTTEASMETPADKRISILELTSRTCRWPYGNPAREEVRYCGCRTAGELPYCSSHARMAYQPLNGRRAA
jgi:GcrA cell cycle regulator